MPNRADRVGYTKSCKEMPSAPRMAMAMPTSRGCSPRPPVNRNGGWCWRECGLSGGLAGSYTGVERNTNHRELKVPMWNARRKCATSVKVTLRVKMRRKGRRRVYRRRAGRLILALDGEETELDRWRDDLDDISTEILASRDARGVYSTADLWLGKHDLMAP